MKNIMLALKIVFGTLAIVLAIMFIITLIAGNTMSYNDPLFDISYILMWVGLGGTPLFAILWFVFKAIAEDIIDKEHREEYRIKIEEQRKIEEAKKEQQRAEKTKAYSEISDIWEYGEETKLAVIKGEEVYSLSNVSLNYSANETEPWDIVIQNSEGLQSVYKAKRVGDKLVGIYEDKVVVLTKGQLAINNVPYFFDSENENVKYVTTLMKRLISNKKIETVRLEHLKATNGEVLDVLPKFHFTISENGIKCDEINFPKKEIDEWFEKNNGGEHMWQNKIFYDEYCKNGAFKVYPREDMIYYEEYIQKLSTRSRKTEYRNCRTDFSVPEWYTAVEVGINKLFKSFKSYESKKTLDVVPSFISGDGIYFQKKYYHFISNKTKKSNLAKEITIRQAQVERTDRMENDDIDCYSVSIVDGDIVVRIKDDVFVCISNKVNA